MVYWDKHLHTIVQFCQLSLLSERWNGNYTKHAYNSTYLKGIFIIVLSLHGRSFKEDLCYLRYAQTKSKNENIEDMHARGLRMDFFSERINLCIPIEHGGVPDYRYLHDYETAYSYLLSTETWLSLAIRSACIPWRVYRRRML